MGNGRSPLHCRIALLPSHSRSHRKVFKEGEGRGWKLQPGVYAAAQLDILQPIQGKQSSLDPAQLAERQGESVLAWIAAELSHNISEAVTVPCRMDVARRIISSQCHWVANHLSE